MDPLERIREAIAKGVRGKELRDMFQTLIEGAEAIPDDDYVQFVQEVVASDPEVSQAYSDAQANAQPGLEAAASLIPGAVGLSAGKTALGAGFAEMGNISLAAGGAKAAEIAAKNPSLVKSVLSWMARNKGLTTLGVGAGIGGGSIVAGTGLIQGLEDTDPNARTGRRSPGGGRPSGGQSVRGLGLGLEEEEEEDFRRKPDYGYNVMVIDRDGSMTGTPGSVVVLRPEDLDPALGNVSPLQLDNILTSMQTSPTGNLDMETLARQTAIANASGTGMNPIQAGLVKPLSTIAPQTIGQITTNAPFQTISDIPGMEIPRAARQGTPQGGVAPGVGTPIGDTGFVDLPGGPTRISPEPTNVPAGAEIAPRTFQEFRGRTLLEWASIAAQRHGVPLNLLYGIVDHESNWNPNAVGDNGNSFGLAQIYMPTWGGQVSPAQARNPAFALEWAAKNLKNNFQRFGRWDAAVAAHNSPVAAQHLAKTGGFLNKKSATYVSSVMGRANKSGVSNDMFELDPDMQVGPGGGSSTSFTPFQAPDPAASREFIEQQYQDLLGRSPTEQEMTAGVQRIQGLAQQSYQANLRQAKGGTSQGVDIEAQFREGIRDTGEFAFTEDTHELNSFTDYAAGVARLLQQGL